MVAITIVIHGPVIARQVHGDKVGPKSSQEVSPQVRINRVRGPGEAQLWQHWRRIHLPHSLTRDWRCWSELKWSSRPHEQKVWKEVPGQADQDNKCLLVHSGTW